MTARGLSRAFRGTDYISRALPRRTFTSSAPFQKHGAVPVFGQTSSPELDSKLSELRRKVFLPAHLSREYQELVYNGNEQQIRALQSDPVVVDISGEEFRLEHIDRTKDVPNYTKTIWSSIDLMKEKKDWDNLAIILQGLKTAGWNLKEIYQIRILKKAAIAERQDIVLELARRVSDTNFSLGNAEVLKSWVNSLQKKALDSDWDEKQTKQALSWLEMTVDLTKDPKHAIAKKADPDQYILITLLQLSAVRAARHLGGKDVEGKVAAYAEKLLGSSIDVKHTPHENPHDKNWRLKKIATVLHGINLAQTVDGPASGIAKQLKAKMPELETEAVALRTYLSENPSKGPHQWASLSYFNKVLGAESS